MRFTCRLWGAVLGIAIGAWACAADAAELEIFNGSAKAIHHVYIAPSGERDWGRDLLMADRALIIASGQSRTIAGLVPATYDLRVIDEDGSECEIEAIEVDNTIKVELSETQLAEHDYVETDIRG